MRERAHLDEEALEEVVSHNENHGDGGGWGGEAGRMWAAAGSAGAGERERWVCGAYPVERSRCGWCASEISWVDWVGRELKALHFSS